MLEQSKSSTLELRQAVSGSRISLRLLRVLFRLAHVRLQLSGCQRPYLWQRPQLHMQACSVRKTPSKTRKHVYLGYCVF
jgi:hypothetical protein